MQKHIVLFSLVIEKIALDPCFTVFLKMPLSAAL